MMASSSSSSASLLKAVRSSPGANSAWCSLTRYGADRTGFGASAARVPRQCGNGIDGDFGIGQPGAGQRRAQLLAQAVEAGAALQQHLHGETAHGLPYLVVE